MKNKISVKNYLEYLNAKYSNVSSANCSAYCDSSFTYMKLEEEIQIIILLDILDMNSIILTCKDFGENYIIQIQNQNLYILILVMY